MKKHKRPVRKSKVNYKNHKTSTLRRVMQRGRFVPAIIITIFATGLSWQPQLARLHSDQGVLAYATNVSQAGLLSATNTQRSNNGVAVLTSSSLLNAAAQAKANDMITRNYWSHQTPDGQQPWVFITNAGYQYLAAGENLAYGYMTSAATVTGWMNSPGHKANLLSTNYTEVGFGIANSANFVGNGEQTVVVAMYAKPQTASAPAPAPSQSTPTLPAATKPSSTKPQTSTQPTPTETAPIKETKPEEITEPESEAEPLEEEIIAVAADTNTSTPLSASPTTTRRIQLFGTNNMFFSAAAVVLAVCSIGLLWVLHKGFHVKKYLTTGERFIAHHLHLDLTVLAIVYLGFVLLSVSGFVR